MRRALTIAAAFTMLVVCDAPARAQNGQERPAVDRAVRYLKSKIPTMNPGFAGISALALIKAEVPLDDPALAACMGQFTATFANNAYAPATRGGPDIYEAAVVLLALVNIDPIGYKPQIDQVAQYLMSKQMGNGAWDYTNRTPGDTSITQYAILALWEAENAGILVSPEVWDRSASWYLSVQSATGSWNYHRDESQWPETISMTAAGVGSLMICQRQLARHRKGQDLVNPLMVPLTIDGQDAASRYKVATTAAAITSGIKRGMDWLIARFQVNSDPIMGQSPYYALYGIERLAALGDKGGLGSIDWYGKGLEFVLRTQRDTGAWSAQHDEIPNTCWAILFGVRSTQKSMKKIEIRRLGAGTLKGGRGLPSDLRNMEVVGGQLVARPMGGAIEGMLAVLEDPRAENADSALAGLVTQYRTKGPSALRPLKDRFRKLVNDSDPGVRRVAVWGLGRTGDLDVAPVLIKALLEADDDLVNEARIGLQILSRKLDGYGPERGATAEKKAEAAGRWQDWFQSVRPPELDAPDLLIPAAAPPAR